jgi:S-layer family protein
MKFLGRSLVCVVVVSAALAGGASAQEQGRAVPSSDVDVSDRAQAPDPWGTAALSVHTINSFAFEIYDNSATTFIGDGSNGRYLLTGTACFEAPVLLPTGAIIDHTELEACDTNASFNLTSILFVCNAGTCTTGYPVTTTGLVGCGRRASATATTVVQNNAFTYTMQVCNGATTSMLAFKGVRVFYRLQVSPAPAVATFPNDVPTTNPFFRFVEALAASGITGGCGAGSYCPDAAVTRGQMAVFLATALGLHFPN